MYTIKKDANPYYPKVPTSSDNNFRLKYEGRQCIKKTFKILSHYN